MASNMTLNPTKEPPLVLRIRQHVLRKQNHQWWGTRSGWSSFVIWMVIINGMLSVIILSNTEI